MTAELTQPEPNRKRKTTRPPGEPAIFASRVVLFWERFWPAILPALAPGFLITIISLFSLWQFVPAWAHVSALMVAFIMTLAIAWQFAPEIVWPSRADGKARMEKEGAVKHAAFRALDDRPFGTRKNGPLWRRHMAKMRDAAAAARLGPPRAEVDARDPMGLRYSALGLLILALVVAGGDWPTRVLDGLIPAEGGGGPAYADLWIEPPAYTGRAPIYLLKAGGRMLGADGEVRAQIDAPEGSVVIAQLSGRRAQASFAASGEETPFAAGTEKTDSGAKRVSFILQESGVIRVRLGTRQARWPVGILADDPPQISFIEEPAGTDENLLGFKYVFEDDYGAKEGALVMRLDPDQSRPLDAAEIDAASFEEARIVVLNTAAGRPGERAEELDLQADPWAGLQVFAKLIITDGAGQIGETPEVQMTLPARAFYNELARAVVEQRQTLAVAEKDWRRAGRSFDALTLAPDHFYEDATEYLLMRTAFWRVMRQDGEGFDEAVEDFWPLALQLEDEALELARQRLEAAEEALRQALERGASDEEIERLVDELRTAMENYLQALAQSGQSQPSAGAGAEQLGQSDLDQMLDAIQDLSQSGAKNAARDMLSDLENILENLRLAQGAQGQNGESQGQTGEGAPGGPGGQSGGGASGAAGDLIGRQRDLANRSFERGQEDGAGGGDLAGEEEGIAEDLRSLLDELENGERPGGAAPDPSGEGGRALRRALNDMKEAENALRGDNFDAANGAMERAISNLRDGAGEIARQAMGEGEGEREGQAQGEGQGLDPLGRPYGNYGQGVDVPDEPGFSTSREVIEELRRRLGEQGRSEEEIEYLERLLERF